MERIQITGGRRLSGIIPISGAKNGALPLLAAGLLTSDKVDYYNVPDLADIRTMIGLLHHHGMMVDLTNDKSSKDQIGNDALQLSSKTPQIISAVAPYDMVRKMRASVLVLGPLLARHGHAEVSLPGGCAIGTRPVDLHIDGLKQMGANIEIKQGFIHARTMNGLQGASIQLSSPSVGATENLMMAASLAKGESVIMNAAREPEIDELAHLLNKMGANITGIGTGNLHIEGVDRLHGAFHKIESDRIEAGSYAIAAAITHGDVVLQNAPYERLQALWSLLQKTGIEVQKHEDGVRVFHPHPNHKLIGCDVMTEPYPGYPTDLQAQFMALLCLADGASMITETIFENRFMHVPELQRMGANISLHGASAMVRGVKQLSGAEVMATDLRASICLIIAALAANGTTTINRIYHLNRGYGNVVKKLKACGATIKQLA